MLKPNSEIKGIDIETALTDQQRTVLSSFVKQQGFDVVQMLMEDQVRKFNLKLINTKPENSAEVLANHYLAKSVAQFYAGLMARVEEECQINAYNNRNTDIPDNDMQIVELR